MSNAGSRIVRLVVAVLAGLAGMAVLAAGAGAAGHPDITLDKEAPARVLYGDTAEVTLTASNPAGEPVGYNLSFRDVLPPGVTYVAGSSPGWAGEPEILANKPTAGRTTLIWSNVPDLTPNSSRALTFQVQNGPPVLEVADSYTNNAGAYINCDPRFVPDFDDDGQPVQSGGSPDCSGTPPETSYTGWATDSATTEVTAIRIRKSEPSPESQLLRGLHNHQTVYTLTVDNNLVRPSNNLRVEDFIPAGLEFLGCGTADNTTDAPTNPGSAEEYPGSGPINPGNAPAAPDCVVPDTVETVLNPAGYPAGVYTHVVWNNLGNMAASDTITIQYVAAVPIRENTMDWTGATPAANGPQTANLDNNSGPETRHRQALTNHALAAAEYQHPGGAIEVTDETEHTVEAMDLRIVKSVAPETLGAGDVSTWNLNIATSEYRYQDNVVVTDTLGDGYCPLGPANYTNNNQPSDAECDPTGDSPSAPYTSVTEQNDGSWIIEWDSSTYPALSRIQPDQDFDLTFPTRTRVHYQENFEDAGNVSANDTANNDVDISGDSWTICAPGDPSPCAADSPDRIWNQWTSGTEIEDDSAASQHGAGPVINKQVSPTVNGTCDASTSFADGAVPDARPGDEVCWRLTMTFPDNLISNDVKVTDFLPGDSLYVTGSTVALPTNTVGIASSVPPEPDLIGSTALSWPLNDGTNEVDAGQVFDVVFKTEIRRSQRSNDGDVNGNLMKAVYSNTAGTTFPLRDREDFRMQIPEIDLLKGVYKVNGNPSAGNPPNTDGLWVQGGDTVTYRVDVSNDGSIDALNTEVWDNLPPEIDCTMVSNISNGGSCNSGQNRIEWSGLTVPAGDSVMLTYDVLIPEELTGGDELVNHAGVRQFESESGTGNYTTIPADNIDPTQEPNANAPSADDPSNVFIERPIIVKNRATQVTQPGNNAADQATIGERIDYTVTVTVPEGTSLYGDGTALVDDVSSRLNLDASSVAATFDNGSGTAQPIPVAGFTLSVTGNLITIDAPNPYHNPEGSGDDVIKLTFSATVRDIYPDNYAQGTATQRVIPNVATLSWQNATGEDRSLSDSADTTLVEPDISIGKSTPVTGTVAPGDDVEYTLQVSNGSGARVSTANDTTVVDTVPVGLTPVNGGTPVADGGTVNPDGGVWDATARTITWPAIATIAPGASVTLSYHVTVDTDQPGTSSLTNEAVTTTTSMPGPSSGERTSTSPGNPPGYRDDDAVTLDLVGPGIVKSGTPAEATIGQFVTNTLTVTVPAEIDQYDVTVTDNLPDGLVFDSYLSATCTAGCTGGATDITPVTLTPIANGNGQRIGWWFGDLTSAPQARTVELKYRTRVAADYNAGGEVTDGDTLVNEASLLFNLTDKVQVPPTTPPDPDDYDEVREDDSTTEVVEPDVTMEKEVSDGAGGWTDNRYTQPGDSYTYRIRVTNNGTSPAYDVVVADEPDVELTNVVVATGPAWQVTKNWTAADRSIGWLIPGPIGVGETVTLTYTADLVASSELVNMQEVDNTASVPEYWGVPEADRDDPEKFREYEDGEDSVKQIVLVPDLVLDKTTGLSGNPDTGDARVNEAFPWRIVITNPNTGSLLKGVDLTDTLPPNWTYVPNSAQITGSGTLTPGGQVEPTVVPAATGDVLMWTDIADLVGDAQNVIVEFDAIPGDRAVLDPGLDPEAHVNDAEATGEDTSGAGGSADGPYQDDDDATATLLKPVVDLGITKVADSPADATAGTNQTWTLTVRNNGPNASPTVQVTDVLPAGLTFVSAVPDQGSCVESPAGTVSCAIGWMDPDDEVEIKLTTLIGADQAGNTLVNPADVEDPNIDDQNPDNNHDEDEVVPGGLVDLGVTKRTVSPKNVRPGSKVTYEVVVTNHGPSDATGVTLVDTLPEGLDGVTTNNAGCTVTGGGIECALGDLPVGGSITVKVTGTVKDGYRKLVNRVNVKGNEPDPNPDNDRDRVTDPVRIPKLQLRKKADRRKVDAGRIVTYTISFRNKVRGSLAENVLICDNIPRFTSVVGKGGGFMRAGRVCWKIKRLGFSRKFRQRTLKLRVDRDAPRTRIVNNVWMGKKKATAKVRVVPRKPDISSAGGVTG